MMYTYEFTIRLLQSICENFQVFGQIVLGFKLLREKNQVTSCILFTKNQRNVVKCILEKRVVS